MLTSLCGRFGIQNATISVAVTDDAGIVKVNKRFLKSGKKTDVISFDLSDEQTGEYVFDMIVNGELALRESAARGHDAQSELVLYILHGFLHNMGYDDLEPAQFKKMHKAEDEILEEFGYGATYILKRKTAGNRNKVKRGKLSK
jgi:probable rRNA maturation factor